MGTESLTFNTEDVTIADDGRVIINDPAFAKRLIKHVKRVAPGDVGIFDNCDCKGKQASAVRLSDVLPETSFRLDSGTVGIFDNCDCTGVAER